MGTAEVQGSLWGARARDWAELQEPAWRPIFREALIAAGVGPGMRVLDIGCGAGGALVVARELGAEPTGFDASSRLAEVARERLPGARIDIGDMEALPFAAESFDRVTGFNSFQFAGDIVRALAEAGRVCRKRGRVMMFVWGRRADCELVSGVLPAIMALMPPPPPGAPPAPFDFGEPGVVEGLMERAALAPEAAADQDGVLVYPNLDVAVRATLSAGPSARAIEHSGEAALKAALDEAFRPFVRSDGSVALKNRFRRVIARPV
jgi:SAM-dependent methyltransferase